jgi:acetyltransferase-like isoleucine patch superfamily enzyme
MISVIRLLYFRWVWRSRNRHNSTVPGRVFPLERVSVGNHSYGPLNVHYFGGTEEYLSIGNFVSIAEGVHFLLGGEHRQDRLFTYPFRERFLGDYREALTKGAVLVEDDVWIGFGATVLSGVKIGRGAIIGACALVVKDVPPFTIVGGVPARAIHSRLSSQMINDLCNIEYSALNQEIILDNSEVFLSEATDENLAKFKQIVQGRKR